MVQGMISHYLLDYLLVNIKVMDQSLDLALLRMHNPEGYADNVTMNPYGPFYYYYHKDHLGNNREVWKAAYSINGTVTPAAVVQQTSYYPSGLPWSDGSGVSTQPYKYNGKEFVEMHGLDTYDYGARGYYPAMGRFMTMDPLVERNYSISPYAYCLNNPVRLVDPDGKTPRIYVETQGTGHTFVTVGQGKNTIVYTYGRYGGLDKDKSSGRSLSATGEGVLVRLKGADALKFIDNEVKDKGAKIYEIANGDDKKVSKHFDTAFDSSDKKPTEGKYKDSENARVVDQYSLLDNNCTTKSVEAVKAGTDGNFNTSSTTPDGIETKLQYQSQEENSNVKQIPYKTVIDENNKK